VSTAVRIGTLSSVAVIPRIVGITYEIDVCVRRWFRSAISNPIDVTEREPCSEPASLS
jgi:hypothetical protein